MERGWSALEVLGEPGEHPDPLAWEQECAERVLATAGAARVLVIGKSLASLLAGPVSDRDLPAVWLTPLLTEPSVIEGLALPGVDHVFQVPGHPLASLDALRRIAESVGRLAAGA
jgi:hypothetical protein